MTTIRLALACVILAPASAWATIDSAKDSATCIRLPLSRESRLQLIDQALTESRANWAGEAEFRAALALREADSDLLSRAAGDGMAVVPNPEPSSLLVWGATMAGLMAAGYGYRRRRCSEVVAAP